MTFVFIRQHQKKTSIIIMQTTNSCYRARFDCSCAMHGVCCSFCAPIAAFCAIDFYDAIDAFGVLIQNHDSCNAMQ